MLGIIFVLVGSSKNTTKFFFLFQLGLSNGNRQMNKQNTWQIVTSAKEKNIKIRKEKPWK